MAISREAIDGVAYRGWRTTFSVIGVAFGVGLITATVGLSQTSSRAVAESFEGLSSRYVTVEPSSRVGPDGETTALPRGATARLGQLDVIQSVAPIVRQEEPISAHPQGPTIEIDVVGSTPALVDAAGIDIQTGRFFDTGHLERADRVAAVGAGAARRLELSPAQLGSAIRIGDYRYVVIGIIGSAEADPSLNSAVVIPDAEANERADRLVLLSATRHTDQVADAVSAILAPDNPAMISVGYDRGTPQLAETVLGELDALVVSMLVVAALLSGVALATTLSRAVVERTAEIGLRRSLGASTAPIVFQFLLEGWVLSLWGTAVGVVGGTATVLIVARLQHTNPILSANVVAISALAGIGTGLLASLPPAIRAARLDPAKALLRP